MSNEITVKVKCELNELYKILEEKGFKITDRFSLNDIYMVPKMLKTEEISTREILTHAVIIRNIIDKVENKIKNKITYKTKEFDNKGNILNQTSTSCEIKDIEEAKKLFTVMGYKEIMNIKEDDLVYSRDGFELAIKDIKNGEKLIEIETVENNEKLDTIEKIKEKVVNLEIPIYTDNYFVKKAEIELNKALGRN